MTVEDWPRRGRGARLNDAEVAKIRKLYLAGHRAYDVARQMGICVRIVHRHCRDIDRRTRAVLPATPVQPPAPRPSRFYKTDFEPS